MNKILLLAALLIVPFILSAESTRYQCVMHPQIVRNEPGKCPICHMDLVEIDAEDAHGHAGFSLSPERQQLIGVKVAKAAVQAMSKTLRLAGRVGGGGVIAQLLEMDAGVVRAGQRAVLIGPDGSSVTAQVAGVEGALDSITRSFAVILSPAASKAWMRGGVYCEAQVEVGLGKCLAVPEDAVIDTGKSVLVFVRQGDHFEPRAVVTGPTGNGMTCIVSGLKAGEEAVVGATFLIDSEARFRAAAAQLR